MEFSDWILGFFVQHDKIADVFAAKQKNWYLWLTKKRRKAQCNGSWKDKKKLFIVFIIESATEDFIWTKSNIK